jgi:platelet-activating factor acetylhydrolase IB subunit alpha
MSTLITRVFYWVSPACVDTWDAQYERLTDNALLLRIFTVTCSSDLFIKIWDSQNEWKNTKTFPGHDHSISSVRFMPGDEHIVSASRDRTIRVFNIASTFVFSVFQSLIPVDVSLIHRHLVRTITGHSDWVRCVSPSDDGRLLASCSNDFVRLFHEHQ